MTPLFNQDIRLRQIRLCRTASRVDIASYNVHTPALAQFMTCPQTRLIIGAPVGPGERRATITSSALAAACAFPRAEIRLLLGSHIKLMICAKPSGLSAIIGSQNLGQGHEYELAVELRGDFALPLANIYQRLWKLATPIKALNLSKVKASLESSEFEVPR